MEENPIELFKRWFEFAEKKHVREPDAAALATVSNENYPAVRIVLVRQVDEKGFAFFTNYHSAKGEHLQTSPRAALAFWWKEIARQVRIEGTVEKLSPEASDAYFQSRNRGKQLAAMVSNQSHPIDTIKTLRKERRELAVRFADQPIPRPEHWGGFRIIPTRIEFWKKGKARLHTRLNYRLNKNGQWEQEFLAP